MKYNYLEGCKSITDVNNRTLNLRATVFKDECEPFTQEYYDLLKEHWNAVVYETVFPLENRDKVSAIREHKVPIECIVSRSNSLTGDRIIRKLYTELKDVKGGLSKLYFQYLKDIEKNNIQPRKADLLLIAELCNYKSGWVYHKSLELSVY